MTVRIRDAVPADIPRLAPIEAEGFDWATRVFMRLPLRTPER